MNNKNKSVLLTGASGFLGRNLLDFLNKKNYYTIPMVRSCRGLCNEIILDFNDKDFSQKIRKIPPVDIIIHLGAKTDWKASKNDLFIPNVLSTVNLVNWANNIGSYFIFISMAGVCGVNTNLITKKTKVNPDTNYGYSKWLSEEIIKMSGVEYLILRSSGIYGRNGPQHLGINKSIDLAIQGIQPIQIGTCNCKRNYIYVEDLCKIIAKCIKKKIKGTHLIGGSEIISIDDMIKIICKVFLSNKYPIYKNSNNKCFDQIIESSIELTNIRKFKESIAYIKSKNEESSCSW